MAAPPSMLLCRGCPRLLCRAFSTSSTACSIVDAAPSLYLTRQTPSRRVPLVRLNVRLGRRHAGRLLGFNVVIASAARCSMKRLTFGTVIIPTASPCLASPLVRLAVLALFNFSSDADVASCGFMCVCVFAWRPLFAVHLLRNERLELGIVVNLAVSSRIYYFLFPYLCTAFQNGRRQVSAKSLSFTTKKNIDL